MTASDSAVGGRAGEFHATRWTLVMALAHDPNQTGRAALAALCQVYWYPLYAFARRRGHSPHDAQAPSAGFSLRQVHKGTRRTPDRLHTVVEGRQNGHAFGP
jgi:RNA polymerase sigma-70 factor (ECF subfamily)